MTRMDTTPLVDHNPRGIFDRNTRGRSLEPVPVRIERDRIRFFAQVLHGDERYFYHGPMYAGDEVELSTTVVDFYDKKGGAMEFVTSESRIVHPTRGVLVRARRTLLHRLPDAGAVA